MDNRYYRIALDYIKRTDLSSLPGGRYDIDKDNVWVNIVETALRPASEARLEAHDFFLDIHIPISGPESYGVKERSACQFPLGEMDTENDIMFFDDRIETVITKGPGEMTIFEPDIAHAPLIGEGPVRKAIFKVRVK